MSKYTISAKELEKHWFNQIRFIQKSIAEFDSGDEFEAQRIATHLRIMFHDTRLSKSIFKQLKPQIIFYSGAYLYTPSNLLTSWTLLSMESSSEGLKYKANLEIQSRIFFMTFDDWWNEIIFDDHENKFTRKDIVTSITNQDGGAHVDPNLDEKYAKLTKMNSLGWLGFDDNSPSNNPAYQSIRAIANEVLISIGLSQQELKNRRKQKDRKFEMRIVDESGRRYKWSETDITYCLETLQIVKKDRSEKRTLYIDEYESGIKVEYIGN